MENIENLSEKNYIKNSNTSKGRTIRLEMVGEVSQKEKNFLNGISYFTAGVLSKNDEKHLTYVSEIMIRLIRFLVSRIKVEKT